MNHLKTLVFALVLCMGGGHAHAGEQSKCEAYFESTRIDGKSARVVPGSLLADSKQATFCLIEVLRSVGTRVNSAPDVDSFETQAVLISATSALRTMVASAESGKVGYDVKTFIADYRAEDDVDVASLLSYAARSEVRDLRMNAILVMGNTIDNSTVCAPLAHLNDASLLQFANGANGRANLLGVVSVVAPWAYRENFLAMQKTHAFTSKMLENETGVDQTRKKLDNIRIRWESQTSKTNKSLSLSTLDNGGALKACQEFVAKFSGKMHPNWKENLPY